LDVKVHALEKGFEKEKKAKISKLRSCGLGEELTAMGSPSLLDY
jgi:hypothetical protein